MTIQLGSARLSNDK